MLIVFEGIDGSGKSSQLRALAKWLRARGRDVLTSFEPSDGPIGKKIRASATSGRLPAEEEYQLFLKDRRHHLETRLQPALDRGAIVLLDRYYFSTMAYQGARGIDRQRIRRDNESFAPRPDILLIFDVSVDTALDRIYQRDGVVNSFEKKEALEECRNFFLSLKHEPFVRVLDASKRPEELQCDLRAALSHLL